MKESQIRDILIQNLHILNPNYKFLNKEAYLPSDIGTRSFIDILACDENGKYIVIELKKSNTTARQAIHELLKYLEALKENLALKTDEIELVVVSTEWDELLVPFSSFLSNVDLKTTGFQLLLEDDKIYANKINATAISQDRILSSIQMARYYSSSQSLKKGIKEHIKFFTKRDIENFVLIILKAPENYKEIMLESIRDFEIGMYGEIKTSNYDVFLNCEYMIYSANQLLSLEKYTNIYLKYYSNLDNEDSVNEILNNEVGLYDKMELFNDFILEQEPFPISDFSEIGTPAKYIKFKEDEGWEVVEIQKFGALSENQFLNNEQIEQEIKASGTTGERYISEIDVTNKASISRVKREISNCLSDNIVWRNHILEIIDSLTKEKQKIKRIRLSMYNPMNILYSIYLICSQPSGILYIPSYQIEVELDDESRLYVGYLDGNFKEEITISDILNKFWNSNISDFFMSLTWGGYFKNNLEVCEYIGLNYKTMLINMKGDVSEIFRYENYRFIEGECGNPIEDFCLKLFENTFLVPEIISFFDEHNIGNGLWRV
ncbi:MAG: DUF91 domain-containing protein [Flavobacterium sp.]|nr:DUF91 domain-containing protein [Flavobacterium sp.]